MPDNYNKLNNLLYHKPLLNKSGFFMDDYYFLCLSVIMPVTDSRMIDAAIPSLGEGGLFKEKLGRGNLAWPNTNRLGYWYDCGQSYYFFKE